MTEEELIASFEEHINKAKDAIGALANKHVDINPGILEYWDQKLRPISHDFEVLKQSSGNK